MDDLLNEYSELLHDPDNGFQAREVIVDDGTVLSIEEEPPFGKNLVVSRRLVFSRVDTGASETTILKMTAPIPPETKVTDEWIIEKYNKGLKDHMADMVAAKVLVRSKWGWALSNKEVDDGSVGRI